MALVLDSSVPLPLLSTVLDTAFDRFQTPMVSLLSSATMTAVAAGVRSALVVDMGWAETVVTSVYEYREVRSTRTVRAGRYLLDEMYTKVLRRLVVGESENEADSSERVLSFGESEDIMCRLMWCRPSALRSSQRDSAQLETVQEEQDETEAEHPKGVTEVPLTSSNPPRTIKIPFEKLADVCDDALFDPSTPAPSFDDHELPVHTLVYQHLLQLPIDVRAICMSRIIFTGGCSNILGLKERIVDEVTATVDRRGWEPVSGKGYDQAHGNPKLRRGTAGLSPTGPASPSSETDDTQSETSSRAAANAEPESDPIEAKVFRHRDRRQPLQGQIRAVHSLGPWAGASLMCQLKTSAMATIDRELWLQQGIHGASRPSEVDIKAQQRQSMGAGGLIRGSGGHHTNWTLGTWGAV
jgi:actin-related protein